ncbi:hypothetical protein BY458DRAFT_433386, partial [Sporodiniella umbellata]
DYLEEQKNEIEALQSIYPDEFESALSLHVTYTPNYPDELPEYEIEPIEGQAEESIGMAMVFSMVMIIKEELDNIVLDVQRAEEEIINERKRKEEEAEQAKFNGTKVTRESFLQWKKQFDAEIAEQDAVALAQKLKELKGKQTGRALFEQDKTLALSDAKFMDDGDMSVDISQFDKSERGGAMNQEDDDDDKNATWKQLD